MNQQKKKHLEEIPAIAQRANLVSDLMETIVGEDMTRDGLRETPIRIAAMYEELFRGYGQDAIQTLKDAMFVDAGKKSLVLVKDIPFASTCEHHMMPFFGTVSIAYIPQDGRIVGISKLARIVDIYAKRLQVQERLGNDILECIKTTMEPFGVAVIIKAEHTCMIARGIEKPGTQTVTSSLDGIFHLDEKARNELMFLLQY